VPVWSVWRRVAFTEGTFREGNRSPDRFGHYLPRGVDHQRRALDGLDRVAASDSLGLVLTLDDTNVANPPRSRTRDEQQSGRRAVSALNARVPPMP
jgi:hypothetical protein